MNFNATRLAVGVSLAVLVPGVCAEVPAALDRINLSLGGYLATSGADARVGGQDGSLGSDVSFEKDFGLRDDRLIGRARFSLLIGDSQGIEIDAYRFHRSAGRSLDRTIVYGDYTWDVDARVRGRLNLDFGSVAYRWWVPAGERDVWGVGFGAAYYRIEGSVAGEATVNGERREARFDASLDAWAPKVELGWRHAWSRDLRAYVDLSGVAKRSGNTQGHIVNLALGVEYFPWEHVGLGFEYGAQRVHIEASKRRFDGDLTLRLYGPSAFLRMRF